MTKQLTETEAEQQYRAFEKARQIYRLIFNQPRLDFNSQVERLHKNMAGVPQILQLENWLNQNHWNFFLDPSLITYFLSERELAVWNDIKLSGNFESYSNNDFILKLIWLADSLESLGFDIPIGADSYSYNLDRSWLSEYSCETSYVLSNREDRGVICGTIGNPISYRVCSWKPGMTFTNHDGPECSYRAIPKDELLALLEY